MKLLNVSFLMALVVLSFYLLVVGEAVLLPLVIAIVFWYLINIIAKAFSKLSAFGHKMPNSICYFLSIASFVIVVWALVELISVNINGVVEVAPVYKANLYARIDAFLSYFNIEGMPNLSQFSDIINLSFIITSIASSITSVAASSGLILLYIGFLLVEQGKFDKKLEALVNNTEREKNIRKILGRIGSDIRKYIGIKLVTSSLTGGLSYLFLKFVGVDFAGFWAVLIFMLNFIPTIGSIIATVFPVLITLAQFDDLTFLIVLGGVAAVQICVGNVLEPRLMGKSLNLSPLIILFNLSLWGLIWGVPGMFLCVPFLVILMIVLSHFPQTRAIAVILSGDGRITTM